MARLTTIREHSDENILHSTQVSTQIVRQDYKNNNRENKKLLLSKRSNSCCDLSLPKIDCQPPSKAYLLRRSQSETDDHEHATLKNTARTYTDFLQTIEVQDDGEYETNKTVSVNTLKQGKETLDRWMKFFG